MHENVRLIKNNNKKNWKNWVPLIGKYSKDVIGNMCKAAKWSIAVDGFLAGKVASLQKGFDLYVFSCVLFLTVASYIYII